MAHLRRFAKNHSHLGRQLRYLNLLSQVICCIKRCGAVQVLSLLFLPSKSGGYDHGQLSMFGDMDGM
ncbi:hypothetical protein [Gimesia aquarii]|uniref:hypothetical protein n=1 Tax=Gimesia aquarii TaxID=2527964 RepID=UPI00119E3A34|nr:hypothetical protein [Gimesia aquarii]